MTDHESTEDESAEDQLVTSAEGVARFWADAAPERRVAIRDLSCSLAASLDTLARAVAFRVRTRQTAAAHPAGLDEVAQILAASTSEAEAWAALPPSVSGDAAPAGATLADRIRALVAERDRDQEGFVQCHRRRRSVEARAVALEVDLAYGGEAVAQALAEVERFLVYGVDHVHYAHRADMIKALADARAWADAR
jgi:hypothetical protein